MLLTQHLLAAAEVSFLQYGARHQSSASRQNVDHVLIHTPHDAQKRLKVFGGAAFDQRPFAGKRHGKKLVMQVIALIRRLPILLRTSALVTSLDTNSAWDKLTRARLT